jgi:CubicO group peptidase (beta-lactamase class C family)
MARLLLAAALALAAPVPLAAAPVAAQQLEGIAGFVDGVMAQQLATREVAGAVVTIVHDGRVVLTRGYGFADVDARRPVDGAQTLFRPGSVSKLFTWTALIQQVERGRVDLDADVNRYLDFRIPERDGQPVRVRDLLAHAPGFSDVSGIITRDPAAVSPYGPWIKARVPERRWAAGTEIAYSNYGAALAGYIVERVSGEPFADYVERHLFAPLGMASTTFREPLPPALAPRMARGYKFEQGRFVAQPFELIGSIMPAGSATTSAPDMARFMIAMLKGGAPVLSPASFALLTRDSRRNAPALPGMAHGYFVFREAGPRLVGHGGNTGDFHSLMVLAPEAKLGFFISMTGGQGSYGGRTELADALVGRLFPQSHAPRVAAPAGETVPAGSYRSNRRDYSKPPRPEYDVMVAAAGDDAITVTSEGQTTRWERIGPLLYERTTGARAGGPYERLQLHGGPADRKLSFEAQPHTVYHLVTP